MTAQISDQSTGLIDDALLQLTAAQDRWAALGLTGRRELLERLIGSVAARSQEWVDQAAGYKGLDPESPLLGEEWTSGPYAVLNGLSALAESIRALEQGNSPVDGFGVGSAPGGRVTVKVLPHGIFDRLLLNGFSAEVWMQPGVSKAQVRSEAGLGGRTPEASGGVGVVLGAGNITSIPLLDVLYELYAHNRVVVLKLNPITDSIRPVFEKAFAPLISDGFLHIMSGGSDVGQYLVHHESVTHVHMTGSAANHDAIVFGAGADGAVRRAAVRAGTTKPLLDKGISSELGGVSPTIVVPGDWSKADLRFQAEHVATQRLHNGGYNCIAAQVVILSADWPQREAFLTELRSALSRAPQRKPYYPGSDQRVASATASYPLAERLDGGRVLIDAGSAAAEAGSAADENAFHIEYFAPVLAVTQLPGVGVAFLRAAVDAANDDFAGTLGVNVIAHPRTLRAAGATFDEVLAELRYGAIAVNTWTGFGFLLARAPWGAYPGHHLTDVQSGIGIVHNALLLASTERTVIRGPFRPSHRSWGAREFTLSPKPPYFVTNRTQATTGRRLTAFAAEPSWAKLPGIFLSALRG